MTRDLAEQLRDAIATLLRLDGTEKEGPTIAGQIEIIERLKTQMGSEVPTMLRHYLERRNYSRALAFLELIPLSKLLEKGKRE